jgi:hypothetical protein
MLTRTLGAWVVVAALGLIGGCGAPFLHSAAEGGTGVVDSGIAGEWVTSGQTTTRVTIREGVGGRYLATLTVHDKGEFKTSLGVDLTLNDIGNARYADLFLSREDRDHMVQTYGFLAVPVHQTVKLRREGDELRVWQFDGRWLERNAVNEGFASDRMVVGGGEMTVVTAPTDQVRASIAKNGDKAEVFGEPLLFRRVGK